MLCTFFERGNCQRGSNCQFSHDPALLPARRKRPADEALVKEEPPPSKQKTLAAPTAHQLALAGDRGFGDLNAARTTSAPAAFPGAAAAASGAAPGDPRCPVRELTTAPAAPTALGTGWRPVPAVGAARAAAAPAPGPVDLASELAAHFRGSN